MELTVAIILGLASLVVARPDILSILGENAIINDVQQGRPGQNIEGAYSWISPEGAEFFVKWIADRNGFRVLDSNAIPIGLDGIAADGNQVAFTNDEAKVNEILGSGVVPGINQDVEFQSSFVPSFFPFNNDFSGTTLDHNSFIPIIKDAIYFTYNPIVLRKITNDDSVSIESHEEHGPSAINVIPSVSLEIDSDSQQEVIDSINTIIDTASLEVHIDAEPDFLVSHEEFGEKLTLPDIEDNELFSLSEEELVPIIHNDVPLSVSEEVVFGARDEVVFGARDEILFNEISSEQ